MWFLDKKRVFDHFGGFKNDDFRTFWAKISHFGWLFRPLLRHFTKTPCTSQIIWSNGSKRKCSFSISVTSRYHKGIPRSFNYLSQRTKKNVGKMKKKRHLEKNFHLQSTRGEGEKVERGKGCKGEGGKVYSSPGWRPFMHAELFAWFAKSDKIGIVILLVRWTIVTVLI